MTTTDATFEAQHPRGDHGQFTVKQHDGPAAGLLGAHEVHVSCYADEPVAARVRLPDVPSQHSMAIGEDQAGLVWTFAEEHRLADGRYLNSVQYVYHAYAGEDQFNIVTETEQFVADGPGLYEATAHIVREGSTWHRYDSAPVVCSRERAESMARRAVDDAHLHQSYFVTDVPWTGEPLARTVDEFREASARLHGD